LTDKFKDHLNTNDILVFIYIAIQITLVIIFGGLFRKYLLLFYLVFALLAGVMILFSRPDKPSLLHLIKSVYPLILIYFFYRVIGIQNDLLNFGYHDAVLYGLEKSILGIYPSFALQQVMEIWLNEMSYLFYCLGLIMPIWALIKLYQKKHLKYFENFILAIEIGCFVCLIIASVYPVRGPASALNAYYYLSILGPFFSIIVPPLMTIITPGNGSFPAIYLCLIILSAYYLWDFGKAYIILSFIFITGVFWGGVYLRYHYLADGLIALLIAFLASIAAGIVFYAKHGAPDNLDNSDA